MLVKAVNKYNQPNNCFSKNHEETKIKLRKKVKELVEGVLTILFMQETSQRHQCLSMAVLIERPRSLPGLLQTAVAVITRRAYSPGRAV